MASERQRENGRRYRQKHPDKVRAATRRWRAKNREIANAKDREYRRKKREAAATRPRPDACECCRAVGPVVWDHNHTTGEFRGWLCHRCNRLLGFVNDSVRTLIALAWYLQK